MPARHGAANQILGNLLLPVSSRQSDHFLLVFRRLLLPDVFLGFRLFLRLCAIRITCHIGLPFSSADSEKRPAPDSFGYRLSMRHKVVDRLANMPCIRTRRPEHHQAIDALR